MKTVIFDFDGTLSQKDQNLWKMIWSFCGYSIDKNSTYATLYMAHSNGDISRQDWFDRTCEYFKEANFTRKDLSYISSQIHLVDGAEKTFSSLKKQGFRLIILSGSLKEVIEDVLKGCTKYFDKIQSSACVFDDSGFLVDFIPTPYDYEGKATFINKLIENGTRPEEIIFVGNSNNDEWVYQTGCKTICINPVKTDSEDRNKWNLCLNHVNSLDQILPYIDFAKDDDEKQKD